MTAACLVLHTSRHSIRWGDTNAFGHDSRADGFRNLERAGFEWLIGQATLLIGMRN